MILPIVAYGDAVLKLKAKDISPNKEIEKLIEDMWETMYNANGVGLAAPQIGKSIRLFLVDTKQLEGEKKDFQGGIKKAFINAQIVEYTGKEDKYEEGCLSIPNIHADVNRPESIKITYLDENFKEQTEVYDSFNARVIQHEYDHIEGILFTDRIKPLKKKLLKKKLDKISKGKIDVDYKMKYPV